MTLQLIGYWKASFQDQYPFPQEVEIELPHPIRAQLIVYLNGGSCVQRYRGFSHCRYGCGRNGSRELSDGIWTWPEGLAHYVQEHRVGLPPEFVSHVSHVRVGSLSTPLLRNASDDTPDHSLWINWAKQYRRPKITQLIVEARARAEALCESTLQAEADREADEDGLSDANCLSAGCTRPALSGVAFCSRCMVEQNRPWVAADSEATVLSNLLKRGAEITKG